MDAVFITDEASSVLGSVRPAYAWCSWLVRNNHRCTVIAPRLGEALYSMFVNAGINVKLLKGVTKPRSVISDYLDALIRYLRGETTVDVGEADAVVNTSNQILNEADIYYFQGYLTRLFDALTAHHSAWVRLGAHMSILSVALIDMKWRDAMRRSGIVIANSMSTAIQAPDIVKVVLYPPIQIELLDALLNVNTDRGDYVLVHVGKEFCDSCFRPIYEALKSQYSDWRWFGKPGFKPPERYRMTYVGLVPEGELPKLYADAKLVIFTYLHEPFGYVPLEAVLAGKPVIASGPINQGPWEQANILNYPVTWVPPGTVPKSIREATDDERARIYLRHHPSTVFKLLSYINNPPRFNLY